MRIVIQDEPICEYLKDGKMECEFMDLPKMRNALFALSLFLDDFMELKERPDTWTAKETKKLFDETLMKWALKDIEEVKS
jgi:hypothetical protein